MEIPDLKNQAEQWPRNKRGRLMLSMKDKFLIETVFRKSGLNLRDFSYATGLKESTVSKILKAGLKKPRRYKSRMKASFHSVHISEETAWSVTGPRGLKIECKNLVQVTELWKSLC
jgi:DNA-directed RNA polymerase specialized sigma54-like protein